jgi:Flp pilus assembly protein TadB
MDLDLEQIVVLTFCAVAVAPLIWIERRSRRNRRAERSSSVSTDK